MNSIILESGIVHAGEDSGILGGQSGRLVIVQEERLSISFGSINTGLPKDIVKQIIAAEKLPIQSMEKRKGNFEAKSALVDELMGLLRDVQNDLAQNINSRSLRELKTTTNEGIAGITADKNVADVGEYQFEVTELARKSSAMTSGFSDPDEDYVGVGYISYELNDGSDYELYVDSDNASLNGVAKLINSDSKSTIRASVVNDGSGSDAPWRLILSLKKTGDDQVAEWPYFYFVDGDDDFYVEFERPAQDAKVKLDGFDIEVPSNKVNDLIPGVTIDLKKASPGEEFTISVGEDIDAISEKALTIVDKINAVLQFIIDQNKLDESSDTKRTLGGDITLQTLESRIRNTVFKGISTSQGPKRFGDLGVTFQKDGLLKLDTEKFQSILAKDYNLVSEILSGRYIDKENGGGKEKGFLDHIRGVIDDALRYPDGIISNRKRGLQSRIDQVDRRIEQRMKMIEQKERNLKNKFSRLESTMSEIRGQGAGLAALGAQSSNVVQQLG